MKIIAIFFLLLLSEINCKRDGPDRDQLDEIIFWDIPESEFPPNRREQAIASGSYVPGANNILSISVWRNKMFVSTFRCQKGAVSGLSYFYLNTTEKSPVLIPYPSFEDNYVNEDPNNLTLSLPSNSSVINALHTEIDKCDRLWLVDIGETEFFGSTNRKIAPPAVVIFDLNSDKLIRRHEIDAKLLNPFVLLNEIRLDFNSDNCDDVHAYIPDGFRAIIVYSFEKDRAWRVEHNFMGSNPHEGNFLYQHLNFQWNYGVAALAVGGEQPDGSKRVYFAPFSSIEVFYVSNQVLQDENYTMNKYYYDFHLLGENGKGGHTNILLYDEKTGGLFNTMFGGATVGCWNTRLPYHSVNTVHKTSNEFYPFDLVIDSDHNLWVLSVLIPFNVFEELKPGIKNIRIYRQSVKQTIAGTKCKI